MPGTLFEELGFNYIGPVDVHDCYPGGAPSEHARIHGPQFLHVVTRQGQGLRACREGSHQVARPRRFDAVTGVIKRTTRRRPHLLEVSASASATWREGTHAHRHHTGMREGPAWWSSPRSSRKRYF